LRLIILLFFICLIQSCDRPSEKNKNRLGDSLENTDRTFKKSKKLYLSTINGINSEERVLKIWIFENLFEFNQIIEVALFEKIGIANNFIESYKLDKFDFVIIRYHPYWSKASKIDCYLLDNQKVLEKIELTGDRHGIGEIELKDLNNDGMNELSHTLEHKVPLVEVISSFQSIYELDLSTQKLMKKGKWLINELNCGGKKNGIEIQHEIYYSKDTILVREKWRKEYDCKKFPFRE